MSLRVTDVFQVKCIRIKCGHVLSGRFNPLNAELNPTCPLLALVGAHHILHVSRVRVNSIMRYRMFCSVLFCLRPLGLLCAEHLANREVKDPAVDVVKAKYFLPSNDQYLIHYFCYKVPLSFCRE